MYIRTLLFTTLVVFCITSSAQQLPGGYILQYRQTFNSNKLPADFHFVPAGAWNLLNNKGNFVIQCIPSASNTDLPGSFAVLTNKVFGDFILEAGIKLLPDSSGKRNACLMLGIKDTTRYYCVVLNDETDSNLHGAYLVKDNNMFRLEDQFEIALDLPDNKWHNIRLERNIVQRTIVMFVNDMKQPVMRIKDYELVMGMIGFGSFSGGVQFDNLSIWAPTMIVE